MSRNEGVDPHNIVVGRRAAVLSSKLLNPQNDAEPELHIHRKPVPAPEDSELVPSDADDSSHGGSPAPSASVPDDEERGRSSGRSENLSRRSDGEDSSSPPPRWRRSRTGTAGESSGHESGESDVEEVSPPRGRAALPAKPSKRKHLEISQSSPDPDAVDSDGMLLDIPVITDLSEIDARATLAQRGKDLNEFFLPVNGKNRICKLCKIKKNVKIDYVKDPSTLRRHLERHHKPQYLAWAKREGFPSMLPSDTAARKHKLEAEKAAQSTLDDHLAPRPERTKVVRYTPEIFEDASIKYAMTNKYFQEMIDVASRATDGVVIPLRKAVRAAILRMFQQNLVKLKNHLNVSF
ncbi:hypothetical protein DFH09DRAFT_1491971, partial [Mycena vulgaris]